MKLGMRHRNLCCVSTHSRIFSFLRSGPHIVSVNQPSCSTLVSTQEDFESHLSDNQGISEQNAHSSRSLIPRVRKRRFCLLLSFIGLNYHGMQFNSGPYPTIEGELMKALYQCGYCSDSSIIDKNLQFTRVSRTDSGVSALRQVVSAVLPEDVNIEKINEHLPSDIKLFAAQRVTRGFHGQLACYARTYCYAIPTFAFCHFRKQPMCPYSYRIDVDSIYKVNDMLKAFEGVHRFHNYTRGRDMMDARSVRRITQFYCSDPYLVEGTEIMELHVTGNSFMLHHIRKMVGMVVALMRGRCPLSFLKETLISPKMPAPLFPGVGLYLEKPLFDNYNKKAKERGIYWEDTDDQVENFKMNVLLPRIVQYERKNQIITDFLQTDLLKHCFKDLRPTKVEDKVKEEEEAVKREIQELNSIIEDIGNTE